MKKLSKKTAKLIQKISEQHSSKPFGYLDKYDLMSEVTLICLTALPEYKKHLGPLENFLRKTVHNRMINRFKDLTKSVKKPCSRCPYYDLESPSQCAKFGDNREQCDKFRTYTLSVNSRNSLLNSTEEQNERYHTDEAEIKMLSEEVKEIIYKDIGKDYLSDFKILIESGSLSKQRFRRLKKEIRKILKDNGFLQEDE